MARFLDETGLELFWAKIKTHVDSKFKSNDAMMYKGTYTAQDTSADSIVAAGFSVDPTQQTDARGWTFKVTGTGYFGNVAVEPGDMIIVNVDTAPGTALASYDILQTNLDGTVSGPSSATDLDIPVFDGTTGKILKDSGKKLADFATATDLSTVAGYFTNGVANEAAKATKDSRGQTITSTYGHSLSVASGHLYLKDGQASAATLSDITGANLVTALSTSAVQRVKSSLKTTTKFYITGVTAANGEMYYDTGVYVSATAGCLHADGDITATGGIAAEGIAEASTGSSGDFYTLQKTAAATKQTLTLHGSSSSDSSIELAAFSSSAAGLVPAFTANAGQLFLSSTGWTAAASVSIGQAGSANNLIGGAQGSIPYQTAAGTTSFLAASSTNGYVLKYNTSTNAPYWAAAYSLPLAASGTRGGIKIGYSASGANLAVQLSSEKAYVALTSGAITSALGTTAVSNATTAANIGGGAQGSIPYQTAEGTTAFLAGSTTNGYILKYSTSTKAPYWAADQETYTLPLAASGTRGGIQIGFSSSGKNIAVQLSSEKAYVALSSSAIIAALDSSSIANAKLANSKFTIGETAINLGDSFTAANFCTSVLGIDAITAATINALS